MKRVLVFQIAVVLVMALARSALGEPAGLRFDRIEMPHHDRRARTAIWYPSAGGGDISEVAGNGVFQGVKAAIWADIAPGQHPVVLFSHGMGGSFRAQAWLAAGLAQQGAIVVAPNHPGSSWGDFDMTRGVRHWSRVADLSATLDWLLEEPAFRGHVDHTRIMAAGFSFGGWTALSMGGARGNHAGILATCRAHGAVMNACPELLSEAVNLAGIEESVWNAAYRDERITHVAAIDPGFVWGLEAQDVAGLAGDVLLIGLGKGTTRMSATDFDASGLAQLLPKAEIARLAPAFHFTAMPLCRPEGEAILEEEKDDPVCSDPEGTSRKEVHRRITTLIAQRLGL